MHKFKMDTPVAFIIFNRPDTTERVFAEIAKAKPPKLLVVSDGPRSNREREFERVAQTREIIERVDWPCDVLTNFSDVNLGCRTRVSSGIDWIFEHVEEAIILEDDCLPETTFFRFCQEMLDRYRHDQRVGMITGDNFQFGRRYSDDSYYFSKYMHIWGWASWRDRWSGSYDVNMFHWQRVRDEGRIEDLVADKEEIGFWAETFNRVYLGEIDTWDHQWVFANWIEGRLGVVPSVNLISNIGFGVDATHTKARSPLSELPTFPMSFPLKHPSIHARSVKADRFSQKQFLTPPRWRRMINALLSRNA